MKTTQIAKLQFMDGVAIEEVVHFFAAGDLQSGNYNLTRLFYFRDEDEWSFVDVETVVVAVCASFKPRRKYFALGRDGLVWSLESGAEPQLERIADAGTGKKKFGYLSQIRDIQGAVYACGDGGQVYLHGPSGWRHIDDGILEVKEKKSPNCHNGIDGTDRDNIYVVGEYGRIFHFDGSRWKNVSADTNCHLERVKCVSRDEVYVCGANGTLLRGNHSGWEFIGDPAMKEYIWDLEPFLGSLYLAVEDRLMVHNGKSLEFVATKLKADIDAHRLSSRGGKLWSFGERDLAVFDGTRWKQVIHPDNA